MSNANTMIPIQHRLSIKAAPINQALHQFECDLRVAIPCIVVENPAGNPFNAELQTVSVQPTIQEVILVNALRTPMSLPILDDVPICFPRAGGWSLTLPIAVGDECMVVFQDMAIDNWWQSGGVQAQPDGKLYRHDIGDAIAIFGISSNPKVLANYSTSSAQLRSDDGTVIIDLAEAGITVTTPAMKVGTTPVPLMSQNFLNYWITEILPFLQSNGYAGPIPPTDSLTTIFEAT